MTVLDAVEAEVKAHAVLVRESEKQTETVRAMVQQQGQALKKGGATNAT